MKLKQYFLFILLGITLGVGGYVLYEALAPKPEPAVPEELIGGKTKEQIAEEFLRDLEAGVYDDVEATETIIE